MGVRLQQSKGAELEISHARTERVYVKLALAVFFGLIFLIALFWGGHKFYVRWQEKQLVQSAVQALQQGDDAKAGLALRAVLELKPSSILAAQLLAELAEKVGNRAALDWRRKVAELEPQSLDAALAWARCAVQFSEIASAQRALSTVNEEGRRTAGYHAAAALVAQARQDDELADKEWAQAMQLDASEKEYQLQLGTLRVRARDKDRHSSGKAMLSALRAAPKQRAAATRALIDDGINRHQNARELLELARDLQAYPEAILSDRLLYLQFLHQLDDAQFATYLTDLEGRVVANSADLAALINWMSHNDLNLLAIDFIKQLPKSTLQTWPVPLALAEVYSRLRDWAQIGETTKTTWRQFDFLRHAYLARMLRAQDKPVAAEGEWTESVKLASAQSESLLTLARAASEWGWQKETLELLWQLSKNADTQGEALRTLYAFYAKIGDTQGLYRVLLRLYEVNPADTKVQNNLAQISLLLNADTERGRKLAADLYRKDPSSAAFTTTYAYSLYAKGDAKGAARVMSGLSEEQLRNPAVAAYYGIFLTADNKAAEAKPYLEVAATAHLLPEEKALVEKAGNRR